MFCSMGMINVFCDGEKYFANFLKTLCLCLECGICVYKIVDGIEWWKTAVGKTQKEIIYFEDVDNYHYTAYICNK